MTHDTETFLSRMRGLFEAFKISSDAESIRSGILSDSHDAWWYKYTDRILCILHQIEVGMPVEEAIWWLREFIRKGEKDEIGSSSTLEFDTTNLVDKSGITPEAVAFLIGSRFAGVTTVPRWATKMGILPSDPMTWFFGALIENRCIDEETYPFIANNIAMMEGRNPHEVLTILMSYHR